MLGQELEEIAKQEEAENELKNLNRESETLETVISEENTVTTEELPFFMGGESDEG